MSAFDIWCAVSSVAWVKQLIFSSSLVVLLVGHTLWRVSSIEYMWFKDEKEKEVAHELPSQGKK